MNRQRIIPTVRPLRGSASWKPSNWLKASGGAFVFAVGLLIGAGTASAQQDVLRQACAGDYKSLCSGVQPGGGRIIACLQQNAAKLSPDCQKALASRKPR
jgi:hypothetical protein